MKVKLIPNPIVVILVLAMLLPGGPRPAAAGDGITTIVAKEAGGRYWAYLFDDKGHDGYVLLQPLVSAGPGTLHSRLAKTLFELEIILPQFPGPGKSPKYRTLIYEKALIDVQGDVSTTRHDTHPYNPELRSGPGLTYLTVEATTQVDVRTPPREVRDYTIVLQLTGLAGILQNGLRVNLGDYRIVFHPQFVFYHFNDFNKMPPVQLSPGMGGMGQAPPKNGAGNVEGPNPILTTEGGKVTILPGLDTFRINQTSITIPIAADFFASGSEPFNATVQLIGAGVEGADTIVRRLDRIELSSPLPSTDTIPIEMVSLSLVSVEPITVTLYDGSQTPWNVEVSLSGTITPTGTMTVTRSHAQGGTFTSEIPVYPFVVFTKVGDAGTPRYGDSIGGGQHEGARLVLLDSNQQPVRHISFLSGEWGCEYQCPAVSEDLPLLEETFVFKAERVEDGA